MCSRNNCIIESSNYLNQQPKIKLDDVDHIKQNSNNKIYKHKGKISSTLKLTPLYKA